MHFPVGIATHMEILFSNSDTSIAWYGVIDDPNWFTTVTMQRLDYINKMVMNPLWILVVFKNQIQTIIFLVPLIYKLYFAEHDLIKHTFSTDYMHE
jgi:hypothetical protein